MPSFSPHASYLPTPPLPTQKDSDKPIAPSSSLPHSATRMPRYKLVFFAPRANTQAILAHLFDRFPQHVGRIGAYAGCAFVSPGTGAPPVPLPSCELKLT